MGRLRRPQVSPGAQLVWCVVSAKTSFLIIGLLVLAASVAGCSGKGQTKGGAAAIIPPSAAAGQNDGETCSVVGVVVDDELTPIAGAQVGLLPTEPILKTVAAEDGSFSFSFVQPGAYSITANKAGYQSDLKPITCEPGGNAEAQLNLPKIPDPQQSYLRMYPSQKGRIGCGLGFWSVTTEDKCTDLGLEANGKQMFTYLVDGVPITGAVAELQWTATSGSGGAYLQMTYPVSLAKEIIKTYPPHNKEAAGGVIRGKSAIQLTLQSTDLNDPLYKKSANDTMFYEVRPSGSQVSTTPGAWDPLNDGSSKVVTGQDFEHYLALFYAGEPVPPNFSMLG